MASTESSGPVNGNYAPQTYENTYATGASNFTPSQQPTVQQSAQQAPASEIPKDEVGWYFVEQYYTTLSKSPDRLFLFYNKRSQYVSGVEEEKVSVCVGQKAINDRIKAHDFKDTKVRVTNVDSQGSDANIVIQVIGEISNQGQPHKRFAQTFVLAEQTNGYFVLNDIFRYLAEDPEEEEELQNESAPANGVQEPASTAIPENASLNQSDEIAASEEDLNKVDNKLGQVAQEDPAIEGVVPAAPVEQVPEEIEAPKEEEVPAAVEEASKEPEAATAEVAEPEKPKEPAPTPAPSAPSKASVAMPTGPPKPAVPKSWAMLAASANKAAAPANAPPASQQVPTQPKGATPTQPTKDAVPSSQTPAPAPRDQSPSTSQGEAAGWQSVTGHKKEQSRAQNQGPAADADQKRAYIKNVYSQVEEPALRAALTKFGEVENIDINRGKNCAFVDFKTPAAYQAAVAANPHNVNGIELKVEERRQGPPANFRGGFPRGGARGRGNMGGQGPPRGGFQPRGRGGPARGRGAPQEA